VGTRYQGQIHYWEVWNEPNDSDYFSGAPEKLVSLAQQAYTILKGIDPDNQIVSPSPYDLEYLDLYLALGGGDYADIIGCHFYILEDEPEVLYEHYIPNARLILQRHGLAHKPLWNTEAGWFAPPPLPDDVAVGYVARAYLLNWAAGVERYYFYDWDSHGPAGVELSVSPDYTTLIPAGVAYGQVSRWLIGARMTDLTTDANDTWTIQLARADGSEAYVVWNPHHPPTQTLTFDIPPAWDVEQWRGLAGNVSSLDGLFQVQIDWRPILIEELTSLH
jgi:hypothetical protein